MINPFGTVQIDGKSYCAGLFWYPLDGGPRNAEQLESILSEQNAAFYVTRGTPATQVGLLDAQTPGQRGALSIAACVAERLTREGLRNFLVALPTDSPDQWCYVAQNQELIQFDGDLAAPGDEVRARMNSHLAAGVDWQLVIAPAEWDVPGAVQRERSTLLPAGRAFGGRSDTRLRLMQRRHAAAGAGEGVGLGAVLCALALMAAGGAAYWVWHDGMRRLEARHAAAQLEQQSFVGRRPWLHKADFAQWAPACMQGMARHALDLAGWNVTRIACHPETARLQVEWVRGPGALFEQLSSLQPLARLSPQAREPASAVALIPLAAPAGRHLPYAPAELPRRGDWQRTASRWAEQWREQRPVFSAPSGGNDGGAIAWTLTGDMPPASLLRTLALPGSVLSAIELNFKGGNPVWTVKATHYVQD